MNQANPISHWHSIRPWSPRFLLTIREITSVSATFLLSSAFSSAGDSDPSISSLGIPSSDEEDETLPITEKLSKNLVVRVNGALWSRFLMRTDEDADEAIVILYGLMPDHSYEIEFKIQSGRSDEMLRSQMVTAPHDGSPLEDIRETDCLRGADDASSSNNDIITSPMPCTNIQPIAQPPPMSAYDDHLKQLRSQLSDITAHKESVLTQLKSSRKETQKTEALIRAEIESLKRNADKSAPVEQRNKQKVLALQEAVKQAISATKQSEALTETLGSQMPTLSSHILLTEQEHEAVSRESSIRQKETDEIIRLNGKKVGDLRAELAGLGHRLEKVVGKREKLANESIPKLEEELIKLTHEIELAERDKSSPESPQSAAELRSLSKFVHHPAPIGSQRPLAHPTQPVGRIQTSKPAMNSWSIPNGMVGATFRVSPVGTSARRSQSQFNIHDVETRSSEQE